MSTMRGKGLSSGLLRVPSVRVREYAWKYSRYSSGKWMSMLANSFIYAASPSISSGDSRRSQTEHWLRWSQSHT